MTGWIKYAAKAVTAGCGAFSAGLATALTGDGVVTGYEWVAIGVTTLGTAAAVFGIGNGGKPAGNNNEQEEQ